MYKYKTEVDEDGAQIKITTISCNDNSVKADELMRWFVYIASVLSSYEYEIL